MRNAGSRAARALTALFALTLCSCASAPKGDAARNRPGPNVSAVEQMEAARAAVAADAKSSESWFGLGLAWQRVGGAGSADSARAAYDKALEIEPDHVEALVHSGLALEDLQRYDDALARYEQASAIAPKDPLPYVNKGSLLYFQYKKTFDAKTALAKALELDPANADAHFNLGVLFADANMFGEARTEWEKVLELAPDGPARSLAEENLERIRPILEPSSAEGKVEEPEVN